MTTSQPVQAQKPAAPAATKPATTGQVPRAQQPTQPGVVRVQGGSLYMTVQKRVTEFREDHPDWTIVTEAQKVGENFAIFRAEIRDEQGRVLATGHKMVQAQDRPGNYLKAAETGAVGRALNFLGYSTDELLEE